MVVADAGRHRSERVEKRRARIIILTGLGVWVVLALVIQLRYGRFPTFLLAGWGGSMVMCLVMTIGPLAFERVRRREPKPRPIGSGNVRNGTSPRGSAGSAMGRVA